MVRSSSLRLSAVSFLFCAVFLALSAVPSSATHYRGGYIVWERILNYSNPAVPGQIKIRMQVYTNLRWTYPAYAKVNMSGYSNPWNNTLQPIVACAGVPSISGATTNSCPPVGALFTGISGGTGIQFNKAVTITSRHGVTLPTPINVAAGGFLSLDAVAIQVVPSQDLFYAVSEFEFVILQSAATAASPLTVSMDGNARLSPILDSNNDTPFRLRANLNLQDGITRSPRSNMLPVVHVFTGQNNIVPIPSQAFDNLTNRFRVATTAESAMNNIVPVSPSVFSLNALSGVISFTPRTSGLYAFQFLVESYDSSGSFKNAVPMEILFQAQSCAGSCGATVQLSTPATSFSTDIDNPITIPLSATVTGTSVTNGLLTITSNPLPPDMAFTNSLQASGTSHTANLRWAPTLNSVGNVVCFEAAYTFSGTLLGQSGSHCLTFTPAALATTLTMAPAAGAAGDTVTVSATLRRTRDGAALPNRSVSFAWDDAPQTLLATVLTDAFGVARHTFQLTQVTPPGGRLLRATFNAIANEFLQSASTAAAVVVKNNPTTLNTPVVTTPSIGIATPISAVLHAVTAAGGGPVADQDGVTFTITGPGGFVQVLPGSITNAAGVSSTAAFVPPSAGPFTVTASFAGNANLLGAAGGGPAQSAISFTALQRVKLEVTASPTTTFATTTGGSNPVDFTITLRQLPSNAPVPHAVFSVNFGAGASPAALASGAADANGTRTASVTYTSTGVKSVTATYVPTAGFANALGAPTAENAAVNVSVQPIATALTINAGNTAQVGVSYVASATFTRTSPPSAGEPIAGSVVTFFYRDAANNVFATRSATTGTTGVATAAAVTFPAAGIYSVAVTVVTPPPAHSAPATAIFPITAVTQPVTHINAPAVSAVATVTQTVTVPVTDAGGNGLSALPGVSITFGPGLPPPSFVTNPTLPGGLLNFTFTPNAAGSFTYTAAYDGTGAPPRTPASDSNTITVRKANTLLTLVSPVAPVNLLQGSPATIVARLLRNEGAPTAVPAGQVVTFSLTGPGGAISQHPIPTDANGDATFTFTPPALGSYAVTAAYAGTAAAYEAAAGIAAPLVTVVDTTAPLITPSVSGTLGANGWYTSDVAVSWTVTDPESAVTSQTGCDSVIVSTDSASHAITCTAESGGGVSSQTVTFKRDATPPSLTTSANVSVVAAGAQGNTVSYDPAAAVDDISGATVDCVPPSGGLFPLGSTAVTCTATNGAGLTTVASFTVAVTNAPPTANDDVLATDEDAVLSGGVLGNDSDVENTPLTAALVSGPSHGALQFNTDGSFTYTPAADYFGSDAFTYRASDGVHDSNVATVSITVNAVNDAPTAVGRSLNMTEDTVLIDQLFGSDVDYTALTFAIVSNASKGSVQINAATGAFTYTPNVNANGVDTFTFVVNDGTADSAPATITLLIAAVNDPPVVPAGTLAATEDTPASGTLAAADPDGDELIFTIVSGGAKGTVIADAWTGAFTYTPNANANGTDSFTYKVNDGTVDSAAATVFVTIAAANDAPAADAGTLSATEDTAAAGTLTGSDLDADTLSFAIASNGAKGTAVVTDPATGAFTYTPHPNANGADSFTFTVNDGAASSAAATITVTVAAVNDAPSAAAAALTTDEDTAATGTLGGADADNDALSYAIATNGAKGVAAVTDAATGAFTYTPNADATGTDTFTFIVNDGTVDSATATVTVTITPVNDAPSADAAAITTSEDAPVSGMLSGADADTDTLTFAIAANGTKGSAAVNPATGAFTYTPNANAHGTDSFTFVVNDGTVDSTAATVTVTITAVNDAPTTSGGAVTTDEDTPAGGTLSAADLDGDGLTYAIVANGTLGTAVVDSATGAFTYTPNANANGADSFTFRVNDGTVDSATSTVAVTIAPVNDAPAAANGAVAATEDTPAAGTLSGADVDGNPLTYAILANGTKGTAVVTNPATGAFTYTPNPNANGADSFTFAVNDGTVSSSPATIAVTIAAVNDAPAAVNDTATLPQNEVATIAVLANDSDVEGSALTPVIVTNPARGTVTVNADGTIRYRPNNGYRGADSFTYRARDGALNSNVATVSITITRTNRAPNSRNDSVTIDEDAVANGNVLANDTDADGHSLTAVLVSEPGNGTLVLNPDGTFTYTPAPNFNGTDRFRYRASDGWDESGQTTVTITVRSVNDAPIAQNDATIASGALPAIGNVLANDSDVDSNNLTAVLVTPPAHGTVTLNSNGLFTYRANGGYSGADSFTYRARDGSLSSNVAVVAVTVQSAAQAVAQSVAVITAIDPSLADEIERILNPVPPQNSCQAGVALAQLVIASPSYSLVQKIQMLVAVTRITATVGCN